MSEEPKADELPSPRSRQAGEERYTHAKELGSGAIEVTLIVYPSKMAAVHDGNEVLVASQVAELRNLANALDPYAGGRVVVAGDELSPMDSCLRPSDTALHELNAGWRQIITQHGPEAEIRMYAIALATLVDELIELRKMPRA